VVWEEHDVTVMLSNTPGILTIKTTLELTYHDQTVLLDENHPCATLGRQMYNDVVVNDDRVSRSHARIEYNRGRFSIIDRSSNGTFVSVQGKDSIRLKREQTQLLGSGVIGLGRDVTLKSPQAIHFAIKFLY
jgi:adenylate cyclase